MICPECGKQEPDSFLFCTDCFTDLSSASAEERPQDSSPQPQQPPQYQPPAPSAPQQSQPPPPPFDGRKNRQGKRLSTFFAVKVSKTGTEYFGGIPGKEGLHPANMDDILDKMNFARRMYWLSNALVFLAVIMIITAIVFRNSPLVLQIFIPFSLLSTILTIWLKVMLASAWKVVIDYELDDFFHEKYEHLKNALSEITKSKIILMYRAPISGSKRSYVPGYIKYNILVYGMEGGLSGLIFTPDKLIVLRKEYTAHDYDSIDIDFSGELLRCGTPPDDTVYTGHKWRNARADGEADRRFKYNEKTNYYRAGVMTIKIDEHIYNDQIIHYSNSVSNEKIKSGFWKFKSRKKKRPSKPEDTVESYTYKKTWKERFWWFPDPCLNITRLYRFTFYDFLVFNVFIPIIIAVGGFYLSSVGSRFLNLIIFLPCAIVLLASLISFIESIASVIRTLVTSKYKEDTITFITTILLCLVLALFSGLAILRIVSPASYDSIFPPRAPVTESTTVVLEVERGVENADNNTERETQNAAIEIDLEGSGITDEILAAMIASGEIPLNTTDLNLNKNNISDITPLQSLTGLKYLTLNENQISDITPLQSLTKLDTLSLFNNQIIDIYILQSLTELRVLSLFDNQISDITPLKSLENIFMLGLSDNQISDLTPLKSLTNLTTLMLSNNKINDIIALESLTSLAVLRVSGNQISDITTLQSLVNLTELYINDNQISDITVLMSLKLLEKLNLEGNPVVSDYDKIEELHNSLPNCEIKS